MKRIDVDELSLPALRMPTFVPRRYYPGGLGNWSGHLAFASDLIQTVQPRLLVELGTHWGESYFGFCQTVAEHSLNCTCYAVDNWQGEHHAGEYGEEVYNDVRRHNQTFYKDFSYLVRSNFADALSQFSDDSIELLHIDGLHTYEACSRDFWSWLPKVRPGGIILLHDICARHADFGLWRLWEEIQERFGESFEFRHSWGLGVVRKPGGGEEPEFLQNLFHSSAAAQEQIRRYYAIYASHLENLLLHSGANAHAATENSWYGQSAPVRVQAGVAGQPLGGDQMVEPGQWTTVSLEFPDDARGSELQLIPSDRPAMVEIQEVSLFAASGALVSRFSGAAAGACFLPAGTIASLNDSYRCLWLVYGHEPCLRVQPSREGGEAIRRIEARIRIDLMPAASAALSSFVEGPGGRTELRSMIADRDALRERLAKSSAEIGSLRAQVEAERSVREGMERSKSWRVTAPLRRWMESMRGSR